MSLFKIRNSFEKNSKRYVINKFSFLLERGFKFEYYNRGGEEEFIFVKGTAQIEVYSYNTTFASFSFEIVISDNGFTSNNRKNINDFLVINVDNIKKLSPIQMVDYYAEIVKNNIDIIEKTIFNRS